MKAQIIYADGRVTTFKPKNGTDFSLEELQNVVGGYIEILDLHNGQIMVVNEEGKLKGLPVNTIATEAYCMRFQSYFGLIVGDVVLCNKEMVK